MSDTATLPAESGTQLQHARPRAGTRCALRPVVVPASLESLHGPVAGLVELPQRLFWSGSDRVFDLSDPDRLAELYEAVFDAARTEADLAEHLNGEVLARLWPELVLAPRVRRAWEGAHPGLTRADLAGAAPQAWLLSDLSSLAIGGSPPNWLTFLLCWLDVPQPPERSDGTR